jgi:hypothetical protein
MRREYVIKKVPLGYRRVDDLVSKVCGSRGKP